MLSIHLRIIKRRLYGAEVGTDAARTEKRPDSPFPGVVSQPVALSATYPPQLRSAAQPLRSKRGSIQLAHAVAALVRRRGRSVSSERG